MRRINGVNLLSRIVSGNATTATTYRQILRESAVLRTCSGSNIRCLSQVANPFGSNYPSFVRKVAGNGRCVSVASSSLAQDLVNDLPRSSFAPKDVVLYQYEACPFCNKVKGNQPNVVEEFVEYEIHVNSKKVDYNEWGMGIVSIINRFCMWMRS